MTSAIPIFIIIGINIFLSIINKRKFGNCLPLTLIAMAFIMFFSGFLSGFLISYLLIVFLSIVGWIFVIRKLMIGEKRSQSIIGY